MKEFGTVAIIALLVMLVVGIFINRKDREVKFDRVVSFSDHQSALEIQEKYLNYLSDVNSLIEFKESVHQKLLTEADSVIRSIPKSTDKKIVLLVGFGAFGHTPSRLVRNNVSEQVVRSFLVESSLKDKVEIIKVVLPVEWKPTHDIYSRLFAKIPHLDAVIAMGHDWRTGALSFEKYYFNICANLDALYNFKKFEKIKKTGPDVIETNMPLEEILKNLETAGIPAQVNCDDINGMTYLCNYSAYLAAYNCLKKPWEIKFVFIHLPLADELPVEESVNGINVVLKTLFD